MRKLIFTSLLLLTFSLSSFAAHIVGGDLFIEWQSANNYKVIATVFRDCNAATSVPDPWEVGVYDLNTNALIMIVPLNSPTMTQLTFGDECYTPTNLCAEEHTYTSAIINLPDNPNGYYFQSQIWARNTIAINMLYTNDPGMTFYAEIADPAIGQNSSPDFGDYPADSYFCAGNTKTFDLNVSDPDGDQLVYSLVDPLLSVGTVNTSNPKPYSSIMWDTGSGFSLANIIGGTPPMTVNSITGEITANPNAIGIYVFALRVEEYRNGVKIGETRRDIQFAALACVFDKAPKVTGDEDPLYSNTLGDETCFDVIISDEDVGDEVILSFDQSSTGSLGSEIKLSPNDEYIYWNNDLNRIDTLLIPGITYDPDLDYYTGVTNVAVRYCWTTDCGDELLEDPYEFKAYGFSIGCSGRSDSIVHDIKLEVLPIEKGYEYSPNVFTPNADGNNDTFKILGLDNPCYDYIDVTIYDRWGNLVYQTNDPLYEWDGTNLKGKELPSGTYYVYTKGEWGAVLVDEKFHVTLFRD